MFNAGSDGHDCLNSDLPVPCAEVHAHLAIAHGHAYHRQDVSQKEEYYIEPGKIGR